MNPFGESEEESDEESSDEDGGSENALDSKAVPDKSPGPVFSVDLSDRVLAFMPMVIAVVKHEGADFLEIPSNNMAPV